MKEPLFRHVVVTGKIQIMFIQWMRALIALLMVGLFCYMVFTGRPVPDYFAALVATVLALYFGDASSAVIKHENVSADPNQALPPDDPPEG